MDVRAPQREMLLLQHGKKDRRGEYFFESTLQRYSYTNLLERERIPEKIFEEIMAENFPDMGK